jgi:ABC-type Zn2+ transport system substrate-binding protein/surface adhesin
MKEAMVVSKEILSYEPNNRIVLEYQSTLKQYIDQGLDAVPVPEPEEEEEEDDEEEEEDEEDESDKEETEETKSEHKR